MGEEEKEFLRIQTDVQISLGLCLGCIALAGAFIIAAAQLSINYTSYSYLSQVGAAGFIVFGFNYYRRFSKKRKEMDKPSEKKP